MALIIHPLKALKEIIEYLLYLTLNESDNINDERISQIVALSHGNTRDAARGEKYMRLALGFSLIWKRIASAIY